MFFNNKMLIYLILCTYIFYSFLYATFLVLTHCLQYGVASFNNGNSGARDVDPTC